jgi:glycerophosphoryl diester phosphodiesterase
MGHPYFDVPRPVVIGHRGCAGEAPENTLPSFERGLAQGAGILESDVHLTRDGVPVLLHDDELERVSNGRGAVREHRLEALRALDFGHAFTPDGGRTHPFRGRGIRVATLEEALGACPGARFNLELKEDVPGIVEAVLDVLRTAKREPLTLLTAEKAELMAKVRSACERLSEAPAQGASAADVLAFLRSALDGAPPPPGPMALQVPESFAGQALVTPRFVEHAHRHGIHVHVWTINERHDMERLLGMGVDGLVTDFPGRMTALLGERDP